MRAVAKFPTDIVEIENVFIPLSDGTRLAARMWLPKDAEQHPVPAILEYLPYRKRDRTVDRDQMTHPYFAGHGYAAVRVDMRGSGDSDGVLKGEYLPQEQDDALEVIDWLARQRWCSGAVGMIGISWGGFNGLQVAARRPPALKAVVSICSTDDRYADDIHFMGGCLLLDKISWYSTMFSLNTSPPDPLIVGDAWRDMWMKRLKESGFWLEDWLNHQRRDAFYKQGSVCEDWSAIRCPVYAVGGWVDGYTNAVFRLLANLHCPRKGL
ncbi:MAG TPA: CocE/NonD family hydrolase, partial [Aestuariivirgaceae bacterium]